MALALKQLIKTFPAKPGVYLMKNVRGRIIYVGRANSLKNRVNSYFTGAHDLKTAELVKNIRQIDYRETDTILESIILEAALIREYRPKYNISQKDDKSFLYVVITNEPFPKILTIRSQELRQQANKKYQAIFGPFTNGELVKALLKTVRRIFPYCNQGAPNGTLSRGLQSRIPAVWGSPSDSLPTKPCFYYHLKQCPGVCAGKISQAAYARTIRNIKLFFANKKSAIIKQLKAEMARLAKQEKFEEAVKIRNQVYYLEHIQDWHLMKHDLNISDQPFNRIEGYDISMISGLAATGSMVVFTNNEPDKDEYRRFRIKTVSGTNDVRMLREVLERRLAHPEWVLPNLILIDGGKGQVNAVCRVLTKLQMDIPVVGIAKGRERKNLNLIYGPMSVAIARSIQTNLGLIVRVRDEAHRFALAYHRKLRGKI